MSLGFCCGYMEGRETFPVGNTVCPASFPRKKKKSWRHWMEGLWRQRLWFALSGCRNCLDQRKKTRSDDEACQTHGAWEELEPQPRGAGWSQAGSSVHQSHRKGCWVAARSPAVGQPGLVQTQALRAPGKGGLKMALHWGAQQSPVQGWCPGWGKGTWKGFGDLTERKRP